MKSILMKPWGIQGGKMKDVDTCKCGHKLAETILGKKWCPRCVGKEMADEARKKLKLNPQPTKEGM